MGPSDTATSDGPPLTTADSGTALPPVAIATLLGVTSRQVHAWAARRETTGFPEPVATIKGGTGGGPRQVPGYDPHEVAEWAETYDPNAGRGAYWASRPARVRVVGVCAVCGGRCDRKVTDPDAPLVHRKCER